MRYLPEQTNETQQQDSNTEENNTVQRLRLTLVERRNVTFTPDTIDNEHHNCKKSKVCCIKTENKKLRDRNKYERI